MTLVYTSRVTCDQLNGMPSLLGMLLSMLSHASLDADPHEGILCASRHLPSSVVLSSKYYLIGQIHVID